MIIGMDFGTTNSGMAVYDGGQVRLLPLDPANVNPGVARTALYVTNDQTIAIGRDALDRYFDQNVGRPVKMKKVWVGEIEVYGGDMYYVTDVYAWTDILSPGRLFLSMKSGLRDPEYEGTVVGQFYYSLETLIASYLSLAKMRAERLLGQTLSEVVLGRPVHFAIDPEADALAEQRLLEAAFQAGYEKVYLQYEPVAAAYHYAMGARERQNVLVFDFGGGTLDITIMRLGGRQGHKVLSTGGVPVAGDIFDQKLLRAKLPPHFGEGSRYGSRHRRLPMPKWIYDVFSNWQTIIELQTPESRKLLQEIAQTAEDRRGIEALISLISNNYSLQMFDVVESAKRKLSEDMATMIRLDGPGFHAAELVTRSEFEQIIQSEVQAIESHLDATVKASGLRMEEIDTVIRTGGSSEVPIFRYLLMEKFGRDKVQATDTFSSVTSGLGIIAEGIARDQIEAEPHTADERPPMAHDPKQSNVASVNLALLQRRMAAKEKATSESTAKHHLGLVILTGDSQLLVSSVPEEQLTSERPIELVDTCSEHTAARQKVVLADMDAPLIMMTTSYRFILAKPSHLQDLSELGIPVREFYQLKADEQITALGHWPRIKIQPKLVVVTNRGFIRAYALERLIDSIEAPRPLQFDQPLPGLPVAVFGAQPGDSVVVVLNSGRATRYPVEDLPLQGIQAINRRNGEHLVNSLPANPGEEIILVTAGGYARRMPAEWVPVPSKPNSRGRVLIARRPVRAFVKSGPDERLWLLTAASLVPFYPGHLPQESKRSTKSHLLPETKPQTEILAGVSR